MVKNKGFVSAVTKEVEERHKKFHYDDSFTTKHQKRKNITNSWTQVLNRFMKYGNPVEKTYLAAVYCGDMDFIKQMDKNEKQYSILPDNKQLLIMTAMLSHKSWAKKNIENCKTQIVYFHDEGNISPLTVKCILNSFSGEPVQELLSQVRRKLIDPYLSIPTSSNDGNTIKGGYCISR